MTVASNQSGAQTAVISTEHTLGSAITTPGVYVLVVDTNAMANGDSIELQVKTKAKAGSTSRIAYFVTYANAQSEANKYSIPVPSDAEISFTLTQTAGTARTFDWNILSL